MWCLEDAPDPEKPRYFCAVCLDFYPTLDELRNHEHKENDE